MPRQLTGSIRVLSSGRFQASVPEAPGSRRRITKTFDSRREADAWRARCVAQLKAGQAPERTDPPHAGVAEVAIDVQARPATALRPGGATQLAALFHLVHEERYVKLGTGSATRGEAVRSDWDRYVHPYLTLCNVDDVREVTREHVVGLATWIAGFGTSVTAYREDGHGATVHLPTPATALKASTARNVLDVLEMVLEAALLRGYVPVNVARGVRTREPNPELVRPAHSEVGELPLAYTAELASHLDVLAQAALWLYRLLGLRAAEAFGIRVGDFIDRGPGQHGLLRLERQGGRSFGFYEPDGTIRTETSSDRLKTRGSKRDVYLPLALTDLLRLLVAAYHTDPVTGDVDPDGRLIPGVQHADRSGLARVRERLNDAATTVDGKHAPSGNSLPLKSFRKQVVSELDEAGFPSELRHAYLGHELGRSVQDKHYLSIATSQLVPVAQFYDRLIDDELGGTLLVPTRERPQFGRDNPLSERIEYSEDVLIEGGWLRPHQPAGLLLVPEIAAKLDLAVTTVRRKLAAGELPGRKITDPSGGEQWAATDADIAAYHQRVAQKSELPRIAEELGVDYHLARRTLFRLFPELGDTVGSRLRLTDEQDAALREELVRLDRLKRRAVTLGAAARELNIGERTLRRYLSAGKLEADPETDAGGATYVTRASLAQLVAERDDSRTTSNDPTIISTAELAALTGMSRDQIGELITAGLLTASNRSGTAVTRDSAYRWACGFRPDLLCQLRPIAAHEQASDAPLDQASQAV